MSKGSHQVMPVIEWSPGGCSVYDPLKDRLVHVDSLASAKAITGPDVILALSRRASFLRTTRLPDAAKSDVAKILALQLGQLFPVDPSTVSVDFAMTANKSIDGRLAVVAGVQTDTLREVYRQIKEVGLRPLAIVPSALGASLLAKHLGKTECAVVRETADGLAIDIIHEGELFASRLTVLSHEPEGVESEVCRSFAMAKLPCADSIATGGFSFAGAAASTPLTDLKFLSTEVLDINLELPEELAKRQAHRLTRAKNLALLMWVAALGVGAVIYDIRAGDAGLIAKDDQRWSRTLSGLRKTKVQAEAKATELEKVNKSVLLAFQPKQRLSDVAVVLSSKTPQGVWLTGFNLERGKMATVRGTGVNEVAVQQYLTNLTNEPRLRDVKLIFANNGTIEATNVVQFSISAHIVGNFPLDAPKGGKK
jgi:Tfp pilus assembly protein PilN